MPRPKPSLLEASAIGVSTILDGPPSDPIDERESKSFLEAQLRCEPLRAQINSIKSKDSLKQRAFRHGVLRLNLVLACTLAAVGFDIFAPIAVQPGLVPSMIAMLAIVSVGAARGVKGQTS